MPGSLVDRTDHLFLAPDPGAAAGGADAYAAVSCSFGGGTAGVDADRREQREPRHQHAPADTVASTVLPTGAALDELVHRVVDVIEGRVVDELERRGRRWSNGGF